MNSNPLLVQLMQFYTVVYAVIKPAIIVYLLVAFFSNQEKNSGSVAQQMQGVMYFILQGVAFVLLSFGAIPPIVAVISAQQMQAEWYITFLFTFSSGGLLFLWVDNKIRLLPLHAYVFTKMLYMQTIQIIGTLCIVFTLISIAMATLYGQIQNPGWWAVPVCTIVYGFLLTWLTSEVKPKFILQPSTSSSALLAKTTTFFRKKQPTSSVSTNKKLKKVAVKKAKKTIQSTTSTTKKTTARKKVASKKRV